MNIWIINGPNLNMLGYRNFDQYGKMTLADLNNLINLRNQDVNFTFKQTNYEGQIIDWLQYIKLHESSIDGVILNAGGYSHTSIAIADTLEMLTIPKVEVHLSNIKQREEFRHYTFTESIVDAQFYGEQEKSYLKAVEFIKKVKYYLE
ncbi:type II 3-dehydroquinate dehydratase [Mollicutes bacterium LVI A0078]|nr:type II 3-dehydroquinate dehydratase [Mollicutes bacterium LVI A0075]WOO90958.1 type II 3-dehydroquinate dehydratase [Mollicutes bacterium LVI A0078]